MPDDRRFTDDTASTPDNERGLTEYPPAPARPAPTLSDLADRFGRWRSVEDDAEITSPPYWTRGADLDDPHGGAGTAYVTPASSDPNDDAGWAVGQRGAVTEWTRVILTDQPLPYVGITADDAVEILGNDVRTVRGPARIEVGGTVKVSPLEALQLVDALLEAVALVTDDDHAADQYLTALYAGHGTTGRLTRGDDGRLQYRGQPWPPEPNAGVLGDPGTDTAEPLLVCGCPAQVVRDEGHQPGCDAAGPAADYHPGNYPAHFPPAERVLLGNLAVELDITPMSALVRAERLGYGTDGGRISPEGAAAIRADVAAGIPAVEG